MFCFEKVFVFCILISKSVLEWFLLIICKEHSLHRSTNIFSRNHPTLSFWLIRECRQMPSTKQLRYHTDKSSHRRYSISKVVLKNFAIFTGKHLCLSFFFNFIKKRPQQRWCFTVAKFLRTPILKNICVRLLLNWL